MKICASCGQEVEDKAGFCPICFGTEFEESETSNESEVTENVDEVEENVDEVEDESEHDVESLEKSSTDEKVTKKNEDSNKEEKKTDKKSKEKPDKQKKEKPVKQKKEKPDEVFRIREEVSKNEFEKLMLMMIIPFYNIYRMIKWNNEESEAMKLYLRAYKKVFIVKIIICVILALLFMLLSTKLIILY